MQRRFHDADVQGARSVYAAVAAHRLQGQPVWPMAVAPPGSLKTEILDALRGLPDVHFIDSVTPNTFISGQILEGQQQGGQAPGLLDRVGQSAILVIADFSTVLSMPREKRGSILADMRRIFDGDLRKEYGTTEGSRAWSGRITFLVGATPDVDRHYAIFQTLGERFLMVRWHRPGGVEAAMKAMNQDLTAAKAEMKTAVHAVFKGLPGEGADVSLAEVDQYRVAALAEFTVRARTQVPRDRFSKEIIYTPEREAATRLAQQLCQLAKGSALLVGRTAVEGEDLDLVQRVAFDCIPATRRQVLDHAIQTENGLEPPDLNVPGTSLWYCRGDLEALELLSDNVLSGLAKDLLAQVGVIHQKSPPNEVERKEELVTLGEGG